MPIQIPPVKDKKFVHLATSLFQRLGIEGTAAESGMYTVSLDDDVNIHLVNVQAGFLNIWCFAGRVPPAPDSKQLLRLLGFNSYESAHPAINLGLNSTSTKFVLWTRQALDELDEKAVVALFERFVYSIEQFQRHVVIDRAHESTSQATAHRLKNRLSLWTGKASGGQP